jgi:hypothetical protein
MPLPRPKSVVTAKPWQTVEMEGSSVVKLIEVLNRTINSLSSGTVTPSEPKLSTVLNEYILLLKTLEEEAERSNDGAAVPMELLKALDEGMHPDTLLHNKLKEWKARVQQLELKLSTLKSLGKGIE